MSLEVSNAKLNNFSYDEEDELLSSNEEIMNHNESPVSETETDSSDELTEQVNQYDDDGIKEYDDEEDQQVDATTHEEDEEPSQINQSNQLYQQNCLAAAQMMQLMCSSGSASSSSSNLGQISHQVSPNGLTENEKENIPICKYCNKVFANFSNLNHHISAIHLNQSKWVCSQCGKICSSKSNLKVHLRVHLRVKPYHCRWCTYSCMHHSSIRDHLAKVHPDKTHTPLQPGYLFNSHAVPEPEVFNSKGFNANTYAADSKMKRSSREMEPQSVQQSPESKRSNKKSRLNTDSKQVKQEIPNKQSSQVFTANLQSQQQIHSPQNRNQMQPQQFNSANTTNASTPMSNLYNAYAMARMLPFMYNPMQMQYAAAAAAAAASNSSNTNQQLSPSAFLNLINQNMLDQNNHSLPNYNATHTSSDMSSNSNNVYNSSSSMLYSSSSSTNSSNHSSDEHPTNTSNLSYSTSSRSSSLSPAANKNKLQSSSSSTSTDDFHPVAANRSSSKTNTSRNIFSVDQMLSNTTSTKVNKETQTDCLQCSHCCKSVC